MPANVRKFLAQTSVFLRIGTALLGAGALTFVAFTIIFASVLFFQPRGMSLPATVQPIAPAGPQDTILVVAAHPDDEFLGVAGYVAASIKNGAQAYVIVVTNGEASLIADAITKRSLLFPPSFFVKEGNRRPMESLAALSWIGVPKDQVYFLGYPTRELKNLLLRNWSASTPFRSPYTKQSAPPFDMVFDPDARYTGENAVADIRELIERIRPTILLTQGKEDENDDHRAVYYFTQKAMADAGRESGFPSATSTREYFFLIHFRQYSFPGVARFSYELVPPVDFEKNNAQWYSFSLTRELFDLKKQGVAEYKSQLVNPYLKLLLNSFVKRNELLYTEESQ